MERKVGGSYDYLCRRVASLFGLRRGGSSRDVGSARWLCRPSARFESASHTPRGQRASQSAWAEAASPRSAVDQAAGVSARYQASHGRIGHRGAGGSRAWDRARSAGYSPVLTTENVASGQKSFGDAMRGWEQSAEHKRNLPLPEAQAAGIAVSYQTAAPTTPWSSG